MEEIEKLTSSCCTASYYPGRVQGKEDFNLEVRKGFQRPLQVETEVPAELSWNRNEALKGIFQEAATAPKSLQSCPTLWDPIDSSSPGSPVPGILQARTLEWVAISFSIVQEERTAKANARRTTKFEGKCREDQGGGGWGHAVAGKCCDKTTGHLVQRRLESGDMNRTRTPRASYVFGYQLDLHPLFSLCTAQFDLSANKR